MIVSKYMALQQVTRIAESVGVSRSYVYVILKKHNVSAEKRRKYWQKAKKEAEIMLAAYAVQSGDWYIKDGKLIRRSKHAPKEAKSEQ